MMSTAFQNPERILQNPSEQFQNGWPTESSHDASDCETPFTPSTITSSIQDSPPTPLQLKGLGVFKEKFEKVVKEPADGEKSDRFNDASATFSRGISPLKQTATESERSSKLQGYPRSYSRKRFSRYSHACRDYTRGQCFRGENCRFTHVDPPADIGTAQNINTLQAMISGMNFQQQNYLVPSQIQPLVNPAQLQSQMEMQATPEGQVSNATGFMLPFNQQFMVGANGLPLNYQYPMNQLVYNQMQVPQTQFLQPSPLAQQTQITEPMQNVEMIQLIPGLNPEFVNAADFIPNMTTQSSQPMFVSNPTALNPHALSYPMEGQITK